MTLAIERKRLIGFPLYFLLWIKAAILFCFSKKLLMNTLSLLIEITKSGKNTYPNKSSHK